MTSPKTPEDCLPDIIDSSVDAASKEINQPARACDSILLAIAKITFDNNMHGIGKGKISPQMKMDRNKHGK